MTQEIGQLAAHRNYAQDMANTEDTTWRFGLLRCLLASAFLLFFQGYMIAPLLPYLATKFGVSRETVGLMVPAYLLPYAIGTFAYGLLADRFGRRIILLVCPTLFALCCALTSTAHTAHAMILWRMATGIAGSGMAVVSLTLIGDLFGVAERGRALGWLFGAIAGGQAFGSTLGGLLTPLIGWRGLFLGVALCSLLPVFGMLRYWHHIPPPRADRKLTWREIASGYAHLLGTPRGQRTFSYIWLNGLFHSGVFTWLGAYLFDRYHLSTAGIGLALLGYGIPGFLGGPLIGKVIDRHGRGKLLPWGLALAALSGLALTLPLPLVVTVLVMTLLSFGFDMSHPLLAGIVTTLAPERRGQAMGLNTFTLFFGFGLGSFVFGWGMQHWGFVTIMSLFVSVQLLLALAAFKLFRDEGPAHQ